MLADLIRAFCNEYEEYEVYENYRGRGMFGKRCIGIVVKQGYSYMDMMYRLTQYLDAKGFEDMDLEIDGLAIDDLGLDTICYFPHIKGYAYEE